MTDTNVPRNTPQWEGHARWEMRWEGNWEEIITDKNKDECVMANPEFYPVAPDGETMVRICAAWNACRGIPTEALEAGVVTDMLEALQALMDLNDNGGPFGGEIYQDRVDRAWNSARAAIAKAAGGAA